MTTSVLCSLETLSDPDSKGFALDDGREIFVVRRGDAVFAYENRCPHTNGPLDWMPDRFLSAEGDVIQCATHDARFRIEDGQCLGGPCNGEPLTPVEVDIRDGDVVLVR